MLRLGHMLVFFVRALLAVPVALRHYRKEFVRLLSDIAWGNGSLVVGGGTAGVAVVLGITVGAELPARATAEDLERMLRERTGPQLIRTWLAAVDRDLAARPVGDDELHAAVL